MIPKTKKYFQHFYVQQYHLFCVIVLLLLLLYYVLTVIIVCQATVAYTAYSYSLI